MTVDSAAPTTLQALDEVLPRIAGNAAHHDRTGDFPTEAFPALASTGALDLTIPSHLGGGGAGLAEVVPVLGAIAHADPSVALVTAMHLTQHAALAKDGNSWPDGARAALQESGPGRVALVNALRVEPDLGTPARGGLPATVARRAADGWSLTGHKIYSTGACGLTWLLVWARTDDDEPRVGFFLVPVDTPGVRIERTWDHIGMRATRSDDVILNEVLVPADHAIDLRSPQDPPGVARAAGWLGFAIGAIYDGIARSARDWLVGYLNERTPTNLGRPLATLPRFQEAVGDIEHRLHVSRQLLESAGEGATLADAATVKSAVTGHAVQAVRTALSLTGNPGLSRHNPLERHYRNALCGPVHTPQDDSVFTAAGRAALASGD